MLDLSSPPMHGFRRWYAVLGGIGWWLVHETSLASLARATCLHPRLVWVLHSITLVTAVGTVLAMYWCVRMVVAAPDEPDGSGEANWERFLGLFGLATGAISLLLIIWEGSYVLAFNACMVT